MSSPGSSSRSVHVRLLIRIAVWTLIGLTFYYLAQAINAHWTSIAEWRPGLHEWTTVVGMICLHTAGLYFLAELWHRLANATQQHRYPRALTYPSYARTQIAKYLPSNLLHFVGRHIYLMQAGATQSGLVLASVIEITIMVTASTLIVVLGLALGWRPLLFQLVEVISPGWLTLAAIAIGISIGIAGIFWSLRRQQKLPPLPNVGILLPSSLIALLFFTVQGLVFFVLARSISPEAGAQVIAIVTLSWLAGYLTPGAPGGIGVREFVMLYLLRTEMSDAEALIAIGLFRLTTTLGDLLMYGVDHVLWRRQDVSDNSRP